MNHHAAILSMAESHVPCCAAAMRGLTCWPRYHRELLACPDGGTVALDWWQSTSSDPALSLSSPILLVLHGLTGEHQCKSHLSCLRMVMPWLAEC